MSATHPRSPLGVGRFLLRTLPLLVLMVLALQILLSGCPSGGADAGSSGADAGGGGSSGNQEQSAAGSPTAHQARGVDPSGRTIDLRFPAAVEVVTAEDPSNYASSGGQALNSTEILTNRSTVRLRFEEPLLPGVDTVLVSGVRNQDGRLFTDPGKMVLKSDDARPPQTVSVLLQAVAGIDNDLLLIVFDDDMVPEDVLAMHHYILHHSPGELLTLADQNADYDTDTRTLRVVLHGDPGRSFDLAVGSLWSLSMSGLRDLGGNLLVQETALSGNVTGDERPPEVLAVTQNSLVAAGGTVVDILVDEALETLDSLVTTNFQFSTGSDIVSVEWLAEDEVIRITLDRSVEAGVDTLTVSGLVDPAGNRMRAPGTHGIDTNDGIPPTLADLSGTTQSGYFNDEVVVSFDERIHPGDAVNPDLFTVESPIGTPVDLEHAELRYDRESWQTTIRFGGSFHWEQSTSSENRRLALLGGEEKGDRYGTAVDGIGDLDGDGFPDTLVGAPRFDLSGAHSAGAVYVLSGRTQGLIRRLDGPASDARFGESLAALPDLNGDGIDDILVGAPRNDTDGGHKSGSLFVYSGGNGALLLQVDGVRSDQKLGEYVASAGDIDGDQIGDLLVGMPKQDFDGCHESGLVQVYSGADGHLLREWGGKGDGDRAGKALAGGFDFDQDGSADILFGAEHADPNDSSNAGAVYIYSGRTGELLLRLEGAERKDHFGYSAAVAGDLNGDQIPDFAIGAHEADVGRLDKAGAVFVHSGVDGSLIFRIDGQAKKDEFGTTLDAGQDLDGDGIPDLLIGAPGVEGEGREEDGAVFVYSGADGSLLRTYLNQDDGKDFGEIVAWAGDLDRDGHADLMLAGERAEYDGQSKSGRVRLEAGSGSFLYSTPAEGTERTSGFTLRVDVQGIRDLAGNRMPDSIYRTAVLGGDFEMPLGVSMVQNLWLDPTGATVDLRFTEPVDLAGSESATFTANPTAELLETTLIDQGMVIRLHFDAPLEPGSTSIAVQQLKDPAGNLLLTWSGTLAVDLGIAPALASTSFHLLDEGSQVRIRVEFEESVLERDVVSAVLWSLQMTGGGAVDLSDATFTYNAFKRILSIEFPAISAVNLGDSYTLIASSLRDRYGNLALALQATGIVTED